MINYLIHRNGRGRLYDDAEANRATYIDRTSSASGFAKLRDCELLDGTMAEGRCQVYGGEYRQSRIKGATICAGRPLVAGCDVDCSEVSGTAKMLFCRLTGNTEVCDSPKIIGSHLENAIIYGSPTIIGDFTVTGRIHEGTWTRPPLHVKLQWCDLTECVDGKVLLNCYCRRADWWLRFGPKVAAKWDWSPEMVEITLDAIRNQFYTVPHGLSISIPTSVAQPQA